ncbi:MAG: MATE family efflux transporter [Eubacterium sp.]
MDRVLADCMILSVGVALVLGCAAYFFGPQILQIYTDNSQVIGSGMEILSITTIPYFLCGIMDLIPGALRGVGCSAAPMILSVIGTVGTRIVWIFFCSHTTVPCSFCLFPIRDPGCLPF